MTLTTSARRRRCASPSLNRGTSPRSHPTPLDAAGAEGTEYAGVLQDVAGHALHDAIFDHPADEEVHAVIVVGSRHPLTVKKSIAKRVGPCGST